MSEREGALLRECRDYLALWPKSGLIDEQEKRLVKRLDIALSAQGEAQTKAVPIPQGWQGSNPNDGAYDGQAPSQPEREGVVSVNRQPDGGYPGCDACACPKGVCQINVMLAAALSGGKE